MYKKCLKIFLIFTCMAQALLTLSSSESIAWLSKDYIAVRASSRFSRSTLKITFKTQSPFNKEDILIVGFKYNPTDKKRPLQRLGSCPLDSFPKAGITFDRPSWKNTVFYQIRFALKKPAQGPISFLPINDIIESIEVTPERWRSLIKESYAPLYLTTFLTTAEKTALASALAIAGTGAFLYYKKRANTAADDDLKLLIKERERAKAAKEARDRNAEAAKIANQEFLNNLALREAKASDYRTKLKTNAMSVNDLIVKIETLEKMLGTPSTSDSADLLKDLADERAALLLVLSEENTKARGAMIKLVKKHREFKGLLEENRQQSEYSRKKAKLISDLDSNLNNSHVATSLQEATEERNQYLQLPSLTHEQKMGLAKRQAQVEVYSMYQEKEQNARTNAIESPLDEEDTKNIPTTIAQEKSVGTSKVIEQNTELITIIKNLWEHASDLDSLSPEQMHILTAYAGERKHQAGLLKNGTEEEIKARLEELYTVRDRLLNKSDLILGQKVDLVKRQARIDANEHQLAHPS